MLTNEEARLRKNQAQSEYQRRNAEKVAKYQREYDNKNREAVRAKQRAYREKNKEKLNEARRKWGEENREVQKALKQKYQAENREHIKAYQKAYREQNREALDAYKKKRYVENREAILEYSRSYAHKTGRHRRREREYGLTRDEYSAMFDTQKGLCLICKEREATCIDHDHGTGKVRGLLCRGCNASLGHFKDNPALLGNAIDYLKKHG